jgi:two-component system, OmpR family, KDP operon response regulator KdpE
MSDSTVPEAVPAGSPPRVLVVEDEAPVLAFVTELLRAHDLGVFTATTLKEALLEVTTRAPDVILLDLGLPDGDGLAFVQRVRTWAETPIIVVSARGREADKVEALDAGADDYLTKPFSAGELMARIRVALRHRARAAGAPSPVFEVGPLRVDLGRRTVTSSGAPVSLTPTEYKLLELLVQHAGRVVTHTHALREVWGPAHVRHPHYVRVHVYALRKKIEPDPDRPQLIVTETGVGYRLRDDSADEGR